MTDITKTITLGGREFTIAPLTLGQMRTVGPAFLRIGIDTPERMAAQLTVIHAAIVGANPTFRYEDMDALTGVTFQELKEATEVVGVMLGLTRLEAPKTGEADAPEGAPAAAA